MVRQTRTSGTPWREFLSHGDGIFRRSTGQNEEGRGLPSAGRVTAARSQNRIHCQPSNELLCPVFANGADRTNRKTKFGELVVIFRMPGVHRHKETGGNEYGWIP